MKLVSYGRRRLNKFDSKICFSNDGQETGLVCLRGTCVVSVNGDSFTMNRNDALYVPQGLLTSVHREQTVDLLECSAPVDGLYPLQFVPAENVEGDEKPSFRCRDRWRAPGDQYLVGQQYSGWQAHRRYYIRPRHLVFYEDRFPSSFSSSPFDSFTAVVQVNAN
jgi:hypothetical protein